MKTHDKTPAAGEAIKRLEDKEPEANNESARTNELLASRTVQGEDELVKASLAANDPSKTRNAYTSDESGFNEDLPVDEDVPVPGKKKVVDGK